MPKATINADVVRNLAALLDETGLTEIEYETGTLRVRVSRQGGVTVATTAPAAAPAAAAPTAHREEPAAPSPAGMKRDGGVFLTLRIFECMKPIVAACNGPAVGVVVTMQCAMDIRMASD